MIYTYRVDCWVNPKSGHDLAEQNKFMLKFKKAMSALITDNKPFQRALSNFGSKHTGMVLGSLIVETDKLYEDNEEEITKEVKKKYPEAIVSSHTILRLEKV